jgi:hypothetical protein
MNMPEAVDFWVKETGVRPRQGAISWARSTTREDLARILVEQEELLQKSRENFRVPHGEVLKHDELYKAYPELEQFPLEVTRDMYHKDVDAWGGGSASGEAYPDHIKISPDVYYGMQSGKSTDLHEIGHEIQGWEGFARGGSPELMARKQADQMARIEFLNRELSAVSKKMDEVPRGSDEYLKLRAEYDAAMSEKLKMVPMFNDEPHNLYRRLHGEAEARETQKRMNLSPSERRAKYPEYLSRDDLIKLSAIAAADLPVEESWNPVEAMVSAIPGAGGLLGWGFDVATDPLWENAFAGPTFDPNERPDGNYTRQRNQWTPSPR